MVQEKTLKSPLDSKEIKPVNSKGNKLCILIERTDAEAEAPILRPPDANSWLTGENCNAGKDGRQNEKKVAEDEMVSITSSMDMNLDNLQEIVRDKASWRTAVHGEAKS